MQANNNKSVWCSGVNNIRVFCRLYHELLWQACANRHMVTEDTENLKKREVPGENRETEGEGKKRLADFPFLNKIARIMTLTTLTTLGASGIFLANMTNGLYLSHEAALAVPTAQATTAMPAPQQAHQAAYQALQALKEKAGEKISELAHSAGSGLITALDRVREQVPETPAELMEHALEERTNIQRLADRHYAGLRSGAYAPVVAATIEAYQESIGTLLAAQLPETVQHDAEKSVLECMLKMRTAAQLVETADFAEYHAQQCSSALAGKGRKGGKEKGKKENDAYAPCKKLAVTVQREAVLRDTFLRLKQQERINGTCLEALVPYLPHLGREHLHAALDHIVARANGLYGTGNSKAHEKYALFIENQRRSKTAHFSAPIFDPENAPPSASP